MKQCGVVTGIDGNYAKVVMQRHSSCGNCNACKMGQSNEQLEIRVLNELNAKVGERVSVDMNDTDVLTAAFLVYVIPLLTLLVSIFIANGVLHAMGVEAYRDIYLAATGFIMTALSFLLLKKREGKLKNNQRFIPVIEEILKKE
ncbi:SoxR reducing system RseC family protein [Alkaliphilus crotonatoxidans]